MTTHRTLWNIGILALGVLFLLTLAGCGPKEDSASRTESRLIGKWTQISRPTRVGQDYHVYVFEQEGPIEFLRGGKLIVGNKNEVVNYVVIDSSRIQVGTEFIGQSVVSFQIIGDTITFEERGGKSVFRRDK